MPANYPASLPAAGAAVTTSTLAAAGHTALHNNVNDEARAIATKIGTGSSTPTANTFLRGSSAGVSAWATPDISTADVTGTLPASKGGTGVTTSTGSTNVVLSGSPTIATPTITSPTISGTVGGSATYSTPTLTTPTIASFASATHNHQNNAGGGLLDLSLIDTTAWTTYVPTWGTSGSAPAIGNGTITGSYRQIGKTVHFWIKWIAGSTTTFGSGNWNFSLPTTPSSNFSTAPGIGTAGTMVGTWYGENPATIGYGGIIRIATNKAEPMWNNSTTTPSVGNITSAIPAWADTWYIMMSGAYETT